MAFHAERTAVKHRVDVVRPAFEGARVSPAPLQGGQHGTGNGGFAAAGARRGDEKLHHVRAPIMRNTGLLATSKCRLPAVFVRLTAICVTSAARPWAVRAATAALSLSLIHI